MKYRLIDCLKEEYGKGHQVTIISLTSPQAANQHRLVPMRYSIMVIRQSISHGVYPK